MVARAGGNRKRPSVRLGVVVAIEEEAEEEAFGNPGLLPCIFCTPGVGGGRGNLGRGIGSEGVEVDMLLSVMAFGSCFRQSKCRRALSLGFALLDSSRFSVNNSSLSATPFYFVV